MSIYIQKLAVRIISPSLLSPLSLLLRMASDLTLPVAFADRAEDILRRCGRPRSGVAREHVHTGSAPPHKQAAAEEAIPGEARHPQGRRPDHRSFGPHLGAPGERGSSCRLPPHAPASLHHPGGSPRSRRGRQAPRDWGEAVLELILWLLAASDILS